MIKLKTINFYKRAMEKKIEIKRIKIKLKKYNICKLGWNDEIKNKQNFYKRIKNNN